MDVTDQGTVEVRSVKESAVEDIRTKDTKSTQMCDAGVEDRDTVNEIKAQMRMQLKYEVEDEGRC